MTRATVAGGHARSSRDASRSLRRISVKHGQHYTPTNGEGIASKGEELTFPISEYSMLNCILPSTCCHVLNLSPSSRIMRSP